MAKNWRIAHGTLRSLEHPNADYLEQVVAHGGLAIAVFGRHADLRIAEKLIHDPIKNKMTDKRRLEAVEAANDLLFDRMFHIPVKLIPKVRIAVIDAVARTSLGIR